MSGQYNVPLKDVAGYDIFYGCRLQRVFRMYKTLKRVKCLYHDLARPRIELADLFCSHSLIQVLPWQFLSINASANWPTCAIPPRPARTDSPSIGSSTTRPRRTEPLFVIMAMHNEDESLFTRTMQGVMKNIAYFCTIPFVCLRAYQQPSSGPMV